MCVQSVTRGENGETIRDQTFARCSVAHLKVVRVKRSFMWLQIPEFSSFAMESLNVAPPPVARPHVGNIRPPPTCHFLPLGPHPSPTPPPPPGRDGEPALLSAPPAPLEGSPQVIREGRPLGSRPMGRRQDVDDECARRLYLRPWRRKEAQD